MALPMTGQRRARTWRLDMVPPPGETWRVVVVERDRSVAGDVLLRNGHMERDCLRRDSIEVIQMIEMIEMIQMIQTNDGIVTVCLLQLKDKR